MKERYGWLVLTTSLITLLLVSALPGESQSQSDREQQLTRRVDEVYQLFVSGGWRQVEQYLTEDSKDLWLAQAKGKIDSFRVESVQVAPDGLRANVTVMATFHILIAANAPFTQAQRSEWLYLNDEWFLKLKPPPPSMDFFKLGGTPSAPMVAEMPLRFDQNPIKILRPESGARAVVTVSFQNVTQGVVKVTELGSTCGCLKAEMDKLVLQPQETGTLTVTYSPPRRAPLRPPVVQAIVNPGSYLLDLPVEINRGP